MAAADALPPLFALLRMVYGAAGEALLKGGQNKAHGDRGGLLAVVHREPRPRQSGHQTTRESPSGHSARHRSGDPVQSRFVHCSPPPRAGHQSERMPRHGPGLADSLHPARAVSIDTERREAPWRLTALPG